MQITSTGGGFPIQSNPYRGSRGTSSVQASGSADTASLDAAAELSLSQAADDGVQIYRPELLPARPDGNIHVEDIRGQYEARIVNMDGRLRALFAKAGIDTSIPIPLQTASDGRVIVAGSHPQKEQIEKLFVEDPKLRNDFVAMTAQGEFLRAVEEAAEFQKAYAEDPVEAVARFKHLFQERNDAYTFVVGEAESRPEFRTRD